MFDMFGKINELKGKLEEVKQRLEGVEVEAQVAGGAIRVVSVASRKVRRIEVDDDFWASTEKNEIENLIVECVNLSLENADKVSKKEIQEVTKGMLPDIPGMF